MESIQDSVRRNVAWLVFADSRIQYSAVLAQGQEVYEQVHDAITRMNLGDATMAAIALGGIGLPMPAYAVQWFDQVVESDQLLRYQATFALVDEMLRILGHEPQFGTCDDMTFVGRMECTTRTDRFLVDLWVSSDGNSVTVRSGPNHADQATFSSASRHDFVREALRRRQLEPAASTD